VAALKGLLEGGRDKKKVLRGQSRDGQTPLSAAASANEIEAATYLIQRGAEPDCTGRNGFTPLRCAVERGHVDMIHCLCKAGAQPWYYSDGPFADRSAAAAASRRGLLPALTALLSYDSTQLNKRAGVPLKLACNRGHMPIVRLLLSHISLSATTAISCLNEALRRDRFEVIMELLMATTYETRASIRVVAQRADLFDAPGHAHKEAYVVIQVGHGTPGDGCGCLLF
jgi:ankyrin repeat protein